MLDPILSICPIDGRYRTKCEKLADYFSEFGLNKYRIKIEIEWLIFLANNFKHQKLKKLNPLEEQLLREIYEYFDVIACKKVKEIETTTNHDVKAVEYYLKDLIKKTSLANLAEFIHLGCTSEDINNLAYSLSLKNATEAVILPELKQLCQLLEQLAKTHKETPMLSLTHGQPATPTTLGKEIIIFLSRLDKQLNKLNQFKYTGKFNGAVGNYSAIKVSGLKGDFISLNKQFIEALKLEDTQLTTQIEPHDNLAEYLNIIQQIDTILLDLSKDIWIYIQRNIFKQKTNKNEIGSSTMPHKVNPIDFENAEGNLGLSIAICQHLSTKLPVSRLQRDLSDSTTLRNIGLPLSYLSIATQSLHKGIQKLEVNQATLQKELNDNPEVLAEAIQTVMRVEGIENPYEKLKNITRGKKIDLKQLKIFIKTLEISPESKKKLLQLTPANYIGEAITLTDNYLKSRNKI